MKRISFGTRAALLLVVTAMAASGCASNRLKDERDALYLQNQELQERLTQSRAALDACEADRENMVSRMSQLEMRASAPQAPSQPYVVPLPPPPMVAANTGFTQIEGVETVQTRGKITVRVPGDILFEPGKDAVRPTARGTLDRIAAVIRREYPNNRIRVEGFTDTDPIRKSQWEDNLELSLARAASVHRYLQSKGIPPKQLEAVGLGEWHPRTSKQTSRRVEIVVVLND